MDPKDWSYLWGVKYEGVEAEDRLYATLIGYLLVGVVVMGAIGLVYAYTGAVVTIATLIGYGIALIASSFVVGAIVLTALSTAYRLYDR